jgi:hypothetical protein
MPGSPKLLRPLCLLLALSGTQAALSATLIVPDDFATIQDAINAANAGDTVIVEAGSYAENLTLRTDIDVEGREAARTFIAPNDIVEPTVTIDVINDMRFSNFTLIDSAIGIATTNSTGIQVASVVFDTVSGTALDVDILSTVDVLNNVFFNNEVAIRRGSIDTQITNNIFRGNTVTITSRGLPINNETNVDFNCFSENIDLLISGVDTGLGDNAVVGNPLFVNTGLRDFHLQQGSPCIDTGVGTDIIDNTVADIGAYGGEFADRRPFPVTQPALTNTSTNNPVVFNTLVEWSANLAYLVTNSVLPGSYRVYYRQNVSGPPYNGTDAGGGTEPSPVNAGNSTSLTLLDLQPSVPAPVAPRLLNADGLNASVVLTWEAVVGVSTYSVYYGINTVDENQIDVGNVTAFTVTGLTNGTTYTFAVSASDQPVYYIVVTALDSTQSRNESVFSDEAAISIGNFVESPLSMELTATPEITIAYPPLPDDCFIATAAFGANWIAEVQALRDFRDRFLLTYPPGRWLVKKYYAYGPLPARYLNEHEYLKPVVRTALIPFVIVALFWLEASSLIQITLVALMLGLTTSIVRRRFLATHNSEDTAR